MCAVCLDNYHTKLLMSKTGVASLQHLVWFFWFFKPLALPPIHKYLLLFADSLKFMHTHTCMHAHTHMHTPLCKDSFHVYEPSKWQFEQRSELRFVLQLLTWPFLFRTGKIQTLGSKRAGMLKLLTLAPTICSVCTGYLRLTGVNLYACV